MLSQFKPDSAPVLDPDVEAKLQRIKPSTDGQLSYYPCSVTLKSSEPIKRVCLIEAQSFSNSWGDQRRQFLAADRIADIQDYPNRLPAKYANKLYKAGESGMGYTLFQLQYSDGSVSSHSAGIS
jgi:hypothetical protein